ncbi:MAG: MliC family protein [Betaproteobacteria bacterium]|nr:MliC family protein [Betaproteobacteria bacterium]
MDKKSSRPALPALVCLCLVLPACGSISLWPFGGEKSEIATRTSNATEYQCAGGKRFHLRDLDNGSAAWIIFPDREFRLNKVVTSAAGTRYSNGATTLDMSGGEATLTDGSAVSFTGCKPAGKP